ncbi:MAG: spermidine/putrescine transport system substrate-binding protein [Thermoleophilaceae bacterium]|nr:spermidine/putrescine transport system substrate-binding protein [Thermoleophilaceae bacterium]
MRDPVEQAIERLMDDSISRRDFVRTLGTAGLLVGGGGTLLAACGGVKGTENKNAMKNVTANHPKVAISELDFSNWPLYIDKKILKNWDKKYGGKVKYTEEINDNPSFFGKVREPLARGQSIQRDIVVLTDWMAGRWVRSGYAEAIDKRNVPNIKNLQPGLAHPKFDPNRNFTLPWQSGMTAIGYNKEKTGRALTSIKDLFDPKFKGKVSLLEDPYDSAGMVCLMNGVKTADATDADIQKAIDKIDAENRKGQIRRFTGNDYTTDLTKGNLWVSLAYSGDVVSLQADNPQLEFLIPDEGALLWTDNMIIPQKAPHPYAAETMMNFVYEPAVAAKIAAAVNYVTPVVGAKEALAKTDPKTAQSQLIFPDDATRAKLQPYFTLTAQQERQMNEAMQKVVGA